MRSPIAIDWTSATNSSEPLPEDACQSVSVEDQPTDRYRRDMTGRWCGSGEGKAYVDE